MRRLFAKIFAVSLGLTSLMGCGPQFNGSLPGRDGTGSFPTPSPAQPQVTSLSPSVAVAGSASFTLTVNGLNFAPTTTVLWDNNTFLTTTYVSSTVLQAQVPASLTATPGTITIVPSPVNTFNYGATFTVTVPPLTGNTSFSVSMLPVQANDMVWDQTNQQLWLSVAKGNATNANTVTALSPQTGAFGLSASTGSEAGKLAVSTDGAYIYAGLYGAASVHRYTLPGLQSDIDIPLGSGSFGPYDAIDVKVEPGNSHSVAVARGVQGISPREEGGIVIYDDALARSQSVPGFPGPGPIDSLLWNPNGQSLYGLDTETSDTALYIMSVSSTGAQLLTHNSTSASLGNALHFDSTTGLLYSNSGKVLDPVTGTVVGSFPLNIVQGGFNVNPIMVPDGKLNVAYFLGQTAYSGHQGDYVIEAFDLTHLTFLGAIPITGVSRTPSTFVRWGSDGLAFLTGDAYGAGATGGGVYLVSGGFVTSPAH